MKVGRRKKKRKGKGLIRTITAPKGVNIREFQRALQKDKFFARITSNGKIVTNAPLR